MKFIKLCRKNLEKTLEEGKSSHAHVLTELKLWKWPYYYIFNAIPIKILMTFFEEPEKSNHKIHMKAQKIPNSQNNFE
jgi:hypothetical protein